MQFSIAVLSALVAAVSAIPTGTISTSSTSSSKPASSATSTISVSLQSPAMTTSASSTSSSASASATVAGLYQNQDFINSMLSAHNEYRAIHGAGALTWDPTKALYAQEHANNCTFEHSGGPYGENLAIGGYSNPAYYAYLWYNERTSYTNYTAPAISNFTEWGHFTQVVWKNTVSVGCGFASTCSNLGNYGPYYLVCEYNTGNVLPINYFVQNVKTPTAAIPAAPTTNA